MDSVRGNSCPSTTFAFEILLTMSDTTSEQPVVLEDEDDAFSAWLKRNHLDQGQPWLFYGEDELFIETV